MEWFSIDTIQTLAIIGSATAAFILIKSTNKLINTTDNSSKKRATVEALLKIRLDSDYIKNRAYFRRIKEENKDDGLAHFATSSKITTNDAAVILSTLNFSEFLATGVVEDAFDEEIYQRMAHNQVVEDWKVTKAFVTELRTLKKHQTLFQEVQCLAEAWEDKPLEKKVR